MKILGLKKKLLERKWQQVIRCPECKVKIKTYCTKYKKGKKLRYYSCEICGKKLITLVVEKEYVIKK